MQEVAIIDVRKEISFCRKVRACYLALLYGLFLFVSCKAPRNK
jgi:hypothetical protein